MSENYQKFRDLESSSQSDDEDEPVTKDGSRKPRDEGRENRGPGQKKRLSESLGATSGNAPPPTVHLSEKGYIDEGQARSKRTRQDRSPLLRGEGFACECKCEEDSNHALNCPMRNLELKDESVGKEASEPQTSNIRQRLRSADVLQQSPKMSHLTVPARSSEVQPTSPKAKGLYGRLKDNMQIAKDYVEKKLLSPKRSSDKGSSSEKADLLPKSKKKPLKVNPNPAKSEASSSSGSPISKKGGSPPDRSLPSTSSSDPKVESSRRAKKNPQKAKTGAGSSGASTSDDSRRRRVETLNVPSGGESAKSSRRKSTRAPCDCPTKDDKYRPHNHGCARQADIQRTIRRRQHRNSVDPYRSPNDSSSTASDSNVAFPRATKSPSKSKKAVSPRVSTRDPSEPGPSRLLNVPSPGNSPNSSDEAARSPSRRSPSRSPSASRRSHRQSSPRPCLCSPGKRMRGRHEDSCPFRSPSRQ